MYVRNMGCVFICVIKIVCPLSGPQNTTGNETCDVLLIENVNSAKFKIQTTLPTK
jgi:hypothetical protein